MRGRILPGALGVTLATLLSAAQPVLARDVEFTGGEITVKVNPNEPTQITFPGKVAGGFKKKYSALSLDKRGSDVVFFANESISESGEAVIIRLEDGRSYSMRAVRAGDSSKRDTTITIIDSRGSSILAKSEEDPAYREKSFEYAPASQVSGLMREIMLAAEFGKSSVPGYQSVDQYRGEMVMNDGTVVATVDRIFMGANLWGYVLDVENLLDQTQKLNPATFRLDGTRAVSAQYWELSPRPITAENQVAGRHRAKVYVVTRAKR